MKIDRSKNHILKAVSNALINNKEQIVTAVGSLVIDISLGAVINLDHNVTITDLSFSNIPNTGSWIIHRRSGTNTSIGWNAAISWNDKTPPIISATSKYLWRFTKAASGELIVAYEEYDRAPVDHGLLAATEQGGNHLTQWTYTGTPVKETDASSPPNAPMGGGLSYSSSGSHLAVGGTTTIVNERLMVYTLPDLTLITPFLTVPNGAVGAVHFSPDGKYLAVISSASPYLIIYDTSDWSVVTLPSPPGELATLRFSPDSQMLAIGNASGPTLAVLKVSDWSYFTISGTNVGPAVGIDFKDNLEVGCAIHTAPYLMRFSLSGSTFTRLSSPAVSPTGLGRACAYTTDGSLFAVAHDNSPYVTIYNTVDMTKVTNPASLPSNAGRAVRFNFDGTKLAVGTFGTSDPMVMYTIPGYTKDAQLPSDPTTNMQNIEFQKPN